MWDNFSKAVRGLRRALGEGYGGGSYRPDLHYMRGPGPKWHAKYGTLATTRPAGSRETGLHEMAERRA